MEIERKYCVLSHTHTLVWVILEWWKYVHLTAEGYYRILHVFLSQIKCVSKINFILFFKKFSFLFGLLRGKSKQKYFTGEKPRMTYTLKKKKMLHEHCKLQRSSTNRSKRSSCKYSLSGLLWFKQYRCGLYLKGTKQMKRL